MVKIETTPIYMCDPEKNVDCTKESCHINGGKCYITFDPKCEKEDDNNDQG